MVKKEIVLEKLAALEEYIAELQKFGEITEAELAEDLGERWKVEHGLLVSIETILDIGSHIISDERLGRPQTYQEIIETLSANNVIPAELGESMSGMAGFRNLLIHEYTKIDIRQIRKSLIEAPAQFSAFIRAVAEYVA